MSVEVEEPESAALDDRSERAGNWLEFPGRLGRRGVPFTTSPPRCSRRRRRRRKTRKGRRCGQHRSHAARSPCSCRCWTRLTISRWSERRTRAGAEASREITRVELRRAAATGPLMGTSDGTVVVGPKILDDGPDFSRFTIVLLADGYQQSQLTTFANNATTLVSRLASVRRSTWS